jgi:TolA-binding protein
MYGKPVLAVSLVLTGMLFASCSKQKEQLCYEAERELFNARKKENELMIAALKPESVEETLESYRRIVSDHREAVDRVECLGEIVVQAQMDIAILEFRTGMLQQSREDFIEAVELAGDSPRVRVNALYSAGFISEQLQDAQTARALYAQLFREFLSPAQVEKTAAMNRRYLITPLKLAEIDRRAGNEQQATTWLADAESIYRTMIEQTEDPVLEKEMRFNLLTTYLQWKKWKEALATLSDLKGRYGDTPRDASSFLFIEATIYSDGYENPRRALELFERVYTDYPRSPEAKTALLTAGRIYYAQGDQDRAHERFKKVADEFSGAANEAAEALWQLAQIDEARGKWVEASLHYRTLYLRYPTTIQGFEAPLVIANHFRDRGEAEAAASSYQTAEEHYRELIRNSSSEIAKILGEQYLVRCYTEQKRWRDAVKLLLELPLKYPDYTRFAQNYLMAASIHEQELGEQDRAAEILKTCMERYPGTTLAAEAEKQYRRIRGSQ